MSILHIGEREGEREIERESTNIHLSIAYSCILFYTTSHIKLGFSLSLNIKEMPDDHFIIIRRGIDNDVINLYLSTLHQINSQAFIHKCDHKIHGQPEALYIQ